MKRILEFPCQFSAEEEAEIQNAAARALGLGEVRFTHDEEESALFLEIPRSVPGYVMRRVRNAAFDAAEAIRSR